MIEKKPIARDTLARRRPPQMTNGQILQQFYEHLRIKGYSSLTIKGYRLKTRFLSYLEARHPEIVRLTAGRLEAYRMNLYYQEYQGEPLAWRPRPAVSRSSKSCFSILPKKT